MVHRLLGLTPVQINYWIGGVNISKATYLTIVFPGEYTGHLRQDVGPS